VSTQKILVGITLVLLVLIAAWPLVAQEEEEEVQESEPNEEIQEAEPNEEAIDPNDPNLQWCQEGTWFGPSRELEGWAPSDPRKTVPPPIGSKEREMGRKARDTKAREVLPPCPENSGEDFCIDSDGFIYSAEYRSMGVDGSSFGICTDQNVKLSQGDRLPNGIEVP
jgi:hypothetical protein